MLVNVSLESMVEDYLRTTRKEKIQGEILYEPENGFMTYIHQGVTLTIPDVYGNGLYWLAKAETLSKSLGCERLLGGTTRNVKAYNRMFGTKVIGYILEKEL